MISIMSSWVECLKMLQPKNLTLFALVSLKSIKEVYKILIKDFWWLFLIYLTISIWADFFNGYDQKMQDVTFFDYYMSSLATMSIELVYFIIFFLIFLLCRASVPLKNMRYAKKFWRHFLYVLLFFALLTAFFTVLAIILLSIQDLAGPFIIRLIDILYKGFVFCMLPFFIFFLTDSPVALSNFCASIKRSALMVIYNYPLCLILSIVFYEFFFKLMNKASSWLSIQGRKPTTLYLPGNHAIFLLEHIITLIMFITVVVPICFIASLYIKRLREQFVLYFDVKG